MQSLSVGLRSASGQRFTANPTRHFDAFLAKAIEKPQEDRLTAETDCAGYLLRLLAEHVQGRPERRHGALLVAWAEPDFLLLRAYLTQAIGRDIAERFVIEATARQLPFEGDYSRLIGWVEFRQWGIPSNATYGELNAEISRGGPAGLRRKLESLHLSSFDCRRYPPGVKVRAPGAELR